jgi:hypothetical protein
MGLTPFSDLNLVNTNFEECKMQSEHFDLNDIQHEPTDAQLEYLMNSVATEANRRAELARAELMQRLREEIIAANRSRTAV